MALTRERVFEVADQLVAEGQSATLNNVRKALGGGSFTTISDAMSEWRDKQTVKQAEVVEPVPESVAERIGELGRELWALAMEKANAKLVSEREAIEQARSQMENSRQEVVELAEQINAELDSLQVKHAETLQALEKAEGAQAQVQKENEALSRQLATTEAKAEETGLRVDDLKTELDHAHKRLAQLESELRESQQAAMFSREDNARLQGELAALRGLQAGKAE